MDELILFKEGRTDVIVLSRRLRVNFRIKKWLGFLNFDAGRMHEMQGIWRYVVVSMLNEQERGVLSVRKKSSV